MPPLRNYWMNLSLLKNVADLQPLSYGLDAVLAMFETTDSTSYLDDAITFTDNVTNRAQITNEIPANRSVFKDNYRGWIEKASGGDTSIHNREIVLSEIYFFQYVTRLLKDIYDHAFLYKQNKYRQFYLQTLDFVETNIWDKWERRGSRIRKNKYAYLLLNRTHMACHWAYIAAELSFLTTNQQRKTDYLNFVELYNINLEKNFIKYGKYIKWNSTWDNNLLGSINKPIDIIEDVSHGNLVVSYIVEANGLRLWKDQDAIQRLINTVKDVLWDAQDCLFRDNIDGTLFGVNHEGLSVGSFQADGFVKLTRYDTSLFAIFEKFISCSSMIINWRQYGQLFANLALSEKLLKAEK